MNIPFENEAEVEKYLNEGREIRREIVEAIAEMERDFLPTATAEQIDLLSRAASGALKLVHEMIRDIEAAMVRVGDAAVAKVNASK